MRTGILIESRGLLKIQNEKKRERDFIFFSFYLNTAREKNSISFLEMLFKEKRKGSFQICFTFRHGSTRLTINPIIKRQGEGWSRSKRVGFEGRKKKKKDPKLALHIEREGRPWEKKKITRRGTRILRRYLSQLYEFNYGKLFYRYHEPWRYLLQIVILHL